MTAVNLNAAGGIGNIIQSVQNVKYSEKNDPPKTNFSQVMRDKAGERAGAAELKTGDVIKKPNRTELKNSASSKAGNIAKQKNGTPAADKKGKATKTADEVLAGAAEVLNVKPEELKEAMDSLNLKVEDLTDRNNVAKLILLLNGSSDLSDMLVDNGMLEAFNELNDFIAETLEESGLTEDEFRRMLADLDDGNTDAGKEDLGASDEEAEEVQADNGNPDIATVSSKEIEITVSNQDGEDGADSGLAGKDGNSDQVRSSDNNTQNISLAENFVRNLEMAVDRTQEIGENVYDVREIVYQVVDKIRVSISPDNTSMEMQLNPENLGKVSISITSKAGVMTAQINTENRQAREAIESQLQILKENIEAKGIKVEAVEVRISDFNLADSRNSESSSENRDGESSGKGRRNGNGVVSETGSIAETQQITREVLEEMGSTVSYTA